MAAKTYDIVVIGGGPGGYPAAIRARQLGLAVALVESTHLGGVCLNWGCIPTKALLHSAEVLHTATRMAEFGVKVEGVSADLEGMVKRSRKIAKRLAAGVKHLLKKNEVDVFVGHGRLEGPGRVRVDGSGGDTSILEARHIILATGARARSLPGLEPDGETIWTAKESMVPEALPEILLVVGSGAIGMEFASFYSDLGSKVTVIEALPRILPVEDEEVSAFVEKSFEKRGVTFHKATTVSSVERDGEKVRVTLDLGDGESEVLVVDRVILAIGIQGNVENLGLESTGVAVDRSHVVTNQWLETGEPGVYAIGDLAGPPWLAHKATHEGILCAERIAGVPNLEPIHPRRIPGCTYCRPQIASVGLSEAAAREAGHEIRVGRFPFVGNGKAVAMGEPEGFVKTIFEAQTGELLGAHMVGTGVTELVAGLSLAMELETTEAELMHTIFPHPTISEAVHESVLAAFGRAIHISAG